MRLYIGLATPNTSMHQQPMLRRQKDHGSLMVNVTQQNFDTPLQAYQQLLATAVTMLTTHGANRHIRHGEYTTRNKGQESKFQR